MRVPSNTVTPTTSPVTMSWMRERSSGTVELLSVLRSKRGTLNVSASIGTATPQCSFGPIVVQLRLTEISS